jgi:predicted ester cyclase
MSLRVEEKRSMRRSVLLVPVLALFGLQPLLTPPASIAQSATPATACAATNAEENKEAVNQFLAAVNSGDDDAAAALTSDGITYHSRGKGDRSGDAGGFLQGQQASFPNAAMSVDLLVAEGDTVAAYVSWSGTLAGETVRVSGQDVSVPEGQRDAEWVGSVFFQFECGKIAHVWPVIDRLGHLMDLGVITKEDLQGADVAATPAP